MITRPRTEPLLFAYATSHRIEWTAAGMLRKDLHRSRLIGAARRNRLDFLHNPHREPAVYRELLRNAGIGPRCVASGDDWIVIEPIDGVPLWQIGEPAVWIDVAAWLARMHADLADRDRAGIPLVRHDAALARRWLERAESCRMPAGVIDAYRRASRRLLGLPRALIHGDLYASNVLVETRPTRLEHPPHSGDRASAARVWPIDWELAGIGPTVLDVAALTAGWPVDSPVRQAMVEAYFTASGRPGELWRPWCEDLAAARLQLCVQWLSWSSEWTPPAEHRHDWLAEAIELSESV